MKSAKQDGKKKKITDENNKKLVGAVPFKVFFDASDSKDQDNNIVDYRWDFDGDGSIDKTGREVSYTFEEIGKYNATLFITDADDNQDQTTLIIQVEEKGITADLKASAITGEVPLEITFDASGSAYPGGEMKHGPIALLSPDFPVFAIMTKNQLYDKMRSNVEEIKFKKVNAKFVIYMEKAAVWERLHEDKFWEKQHCIIMSSQGQSTRGIRRLLQRLSQVLICSKDTLLTHSTVSVF